MKAKNKIKKLLESTGVEIGGPKPYDIKVNNEDFYNRIVRHGSLGLGESYMEGWWDCNQIDELVSRVLTQTRAKPLKPSPSLIFWFVTQAIVNAQNKRRAFKVGEEHYDLGNDLYQAMLGSYMAYSCGYWNKATNLDEAQKNKLDLVCKKIGLKPGMRVLDVGCGWGSFAKYAAENYGVSVVGITISKEQAELARERVMGLDVEIRVQDYRELNEQFDRAVSIGMFEHVGRKNYKEHMEVVSRNLKKDGMYLLHTIGGNKSYLVGDAWMEKYIFANGMIPSIKQIGKSIEKIFIMEDWHNFGPDYDKTLMAWFDNFDKAWPGLRTKYGDKFYRMWTFYLKTCAGLFRSRYLQLWQIVLSKEGVSGGYKSVR